MNKAGILLRIAVGQAEIFPIEEAQKMLAQSRRVDTLGPIFDPTGWTHCADMERELADLLYGYLCFVENARAMAEKYPSLPIRPATEPYHEVSEALAEIRRAIEENGG